MVLHYPQCPTESISPPSMVRQNYFFSDENFPLCERIPLFSTYPDERKARKTHLTPI